MFFPWTCQKLFSKPCRVAAVKLISSPLNLQGEISLGEGYYSHGSTSVASIILFPVLFCLNHGLTHTVLHGEEEAATVLERSVFWPFFGVPPGMVLPLGRVFALHIHKDAHKCFWQTPQHLRECSLRHCLGLKPGVLW